MDKQGNDRLKVMRNCVLQADDPNISVRNGGDDECLAYVMQDVLTYIEACFDLADNPLQHLRKYFSFFEWEFIKPKTIDEVISTVNNADYVWPDWAGSDWSTGMIVARCKYGKERRKICFKPDATGFWGDDEAKRNGARFLMRNNDYNPPQEFI